jgi:hypothetical protein
VVVVNELHERLKSALSIELLGAHAFGDLLGVAFNSNNECVAELPVLNIPLIQTRLPSCRRRFV